MGNFSLDANTTGDKNTAYGYAALTSNTTSHLNTAVGNDALFENTTGSLNTAVGASSLDANTTGDENTAVGFNTLSDNTTGTGNSALGKNALKDCTTASNNVAVGLDSLTSSTTGSENTCVGRQSGQNLTTGSGNVFIGNNAGTGSAPNGNHVTASNRIVLGDNNITDAHMKVSFVATSDERDKADIADFTKGLDFVNALRPVTYKWDMRSNYSDDLSATPDGTHKKERTEVGLIAQEVETIEKANGFATNENDRLFISLSSDGKNYGLRYERLVTVLVNAVKELSNKVTALEAG